ncbi:hypothetical protein LguiB_026326 [Lonicera macranthoides]
MEKKHDGEERRRWRRRRRELSNFIVKIADEISDFKQAIAEGMGEFSALLCVDGVCALMVFVGGFCWTDESVTMNSTTVYVNSDCEQCRHKLIKNEDEHETFFIKVDSPDSAYASPAIPVVIVLSSSLGSIKNTPVRTLADAKTLCGMERRQWPEDMNKDCLVNIFGRVGIESLAFAHYPSDRYLDMGRRSKAVDMGAMNRSQKFATELVLPFIFNHSAFAQVLEECPALKCLSIHLYLCQCPKLFPYIASKWKTLEKLEILQSDEIKLEEVIVQERIGDDLKGCGKLVHFHVSYGRGFESNNEEILKLRLTANLLRSI